MKKLITGTMGFLFLLMGFVAFQSVQGAAAAPSIKAGVACSGLGESRIADDRSMIVACVMQNSGTAATACGVGSPCLWKPMNPVIMDTAGNIGVGTATPAAKLDVAGNMRVADKLSVVSDTNVSGHLAAGQGASVQLGLTVGSGVKMGNDGAACSAAKEGTQRYNSGTKMMEFCNGSSWTTVGSSGGAFGGMYESGLRVIPTSFGGCGGTLPVCVYANSMTGACSCPAGFIAREIHKETLLCSAYRMIYYCSN